MVKLALGYGVSGVSIAKACKRLNVPRPPSGYWSQIASGQQIQKPALPIISDGTPEFVLIDSSRSTAYPAPEEPAMMGIQKIVIPDDLRRCHPLISATRKELESCKTSDNKLLIATTAGTLSVSVSRASLHRALCIMEALIRTAESLGWKVESCAKRAGTQITPENAPISLELSEKVDRSEKARPPRALAFR